MAIRILTKNGIENTNIDGARDNNFNAGRRSGIVKGALNEGNVYGTSNTLTLEPCELRICGHRIVIDENENRTFTNRPQTATKQSLIAQIQVDGENVVFELIVQNSSTALVQDNLDINGNGTYQLEIGTFIQNTDGTISDVVKTADLITGALNEKLLNSKVDKEKILETLIYDGKTTNSLSSITINNFTLNNNEVLCYDISFLSSNRADLCFQVNSNTTSYHTYGMAHNTMDAHYNSSCWYGGYAIEGRFMGHGEIITIEGDATMLCKGVCTSDTEGSYRNFGGSCNLAGETITSIKFYLTSGNLPVDTYIKVYKKLKAV